MPAQLSQIWKDWPLPLTVTKPCVGMLNRYHSTWQLRNGCLSHQTLDKCVFPSTGFTFCYSNSILWNSIFGKWYLGGTVESPCLIQIAAVKQHLVWQRFATVIHKVVPWELNKSCAVISSSEEWSFLPLQIHLLCHLPLPKMQGFESPLAARTGIFASSQMKLDSKEAFSLRVL